MDLLEDLLDGAPPWEYNDNVDMVDSSSMTAGGEGGPTQSFSPKETIAFPPHWGELMEQIRVREEEMKRVMLSRRSRESVSGEPTRAAATPSPAPLFKTPQGMLPVSAYSLLPSANGSDEAAFQPPYVPYPHMPFWTAAPLPFSPNVYPVNVLPPNARESLLAPRAPPRPAAETKKKKQPRQRGRGRPRDAKGLFLKSPEEQPEAAAATAAVGAAGDEATNVLLMGRIQELQRALQQSRYESVVLREQLVHSQMELSQLKDRGLVRANLKGMEQATQPVAIPQAAAAAAAAAGGASAGPANVFGGVKAGSPPQATMNAFRVQLDYAQIKSKLRPTHSGHYDAELAEHEAAQQQYAQQQQYLQQQYLQQQQQQQQLQQQQVSPRPAAALGLNWDLE